VRGVVDEKNVKAGKVKIYAPDGFLEEAVSENVLAGTAMSRRASYMYGNLTPSGPGGQTTAGLGVSTSSGRVTLLAPTDIIKKTGEKRSIDGIEYEFVMAGSDAPSEMLGVRRRTGVGHPRCVVLHPLSALCTFGRRRLDQDGRVTFDEAYRYAYEGTIRSTTRTLAAGERGWLFRRWRHVRLTADGGWAGPFEGLRRVVLHHSEAYG
jgi:hypothetical protein